MKKLKVWVVAILFAFSFPLFSHEPLFSQVIDAEEYLEEDYEKMGFTEFKDFSIDERGEPICEGRRCTRKDIRWDDIPADVKTATKLIKAIPRNECRVEEYREIGIKFRLRYKKGGTGLVRREIGEDGWIKEAQEERLIGYYVFERSCAEERVEWVDTKLTFRVKKPKPVLEMWHETKLSPLKKSSSKNKK